MSFCEMCAANGYCQLRVKAKRDELGEDGVARVLTDCKENPVELAKTIAEQESIHIGKATAPFRPTRPANSRSGPRGRSDASHRG